MRSSIKMVVIGVAVLLAAQAYGLGKIGFNFRPSSSVDYDIPPGSQAGFVLAESFFGLHVARPVFFYAQNIANG